MLLDPFPERRKAANTFSSFRLFVSRNFFQLASCLFSLPPKFNWFTFALNLSFSLLHIHGSDARGEHPFFSIFVGLVSSIFQFLSFRV
jgi:hypothetical protein